MALRFALIFFRSGRTGIRDGLASIRMEGTLCLNPSRRSLTAGTRKWRLIVALLLLEWTAAMDDVVIRRRKRTMNDSLLRCFVVGSELMLLLRCRKQANCFFVVGSELALLSKLLD